MRPSMFHTSPNLQHPYHKLLSLNILRILLPVTESRVLPVVQRENSPLEEI
jgi:hypothetical protein